MKNTLVRSILLCSTSISICGANFVFAQANETDESEIENVYVFGTRQAYQGDFDVLETPLSELKLDSELLRNAGAIELTRALDLSASVARQNNFGGLWNSFAVRGFVGDENLPSNYLVNGFNAGRGFAGPRDLSGIESVEILKGPRAALFGRGEPGGTINLVTKRPTFETEGEFVLSAGSFDTYRTDIDWTSPISDSVAIRFIGFYEDADSFRDTIETKKQGISPSIAWRISDASQLVYELEYSDQEIPFDRGVVAIDGELGRVPVSRFLGEPGDGPMEADVQGHQLEFQHDFNESWSTLVGFNTRDTSLEGFATETNLTTLTGDVDTVGRFRRFRDYDASYYVFRAEITGRFETGNIEHRVIIGVDSDKFENDQIFLRIRNNEPEVPQEINIFNPIYGQYELPEPNPNTDRVETQVSSGIFVQDHITLTDKLDIRIGIRSDVFFQELNNRASSTISSQGETRLSPQFGMVYKTSDVVSLYASYGENFRPLSGSDADGNGFDPNQTESVEAGVKFDLNDGALVGVATVFLVEQDNILTVDENFNGLAIGEASSQGFEFDLNGEIAKDLRLYASYAYVDAETANEFNDPNFGVVVPAGSPLLNIADHQLSIELVKTALLFDKEITFGGGLLYVGERNGYFGVDFDLPSYTVANVFAAYDVSDALELRMHIDNIFEEEYYVNSFADTWIQPGSPLNAKVSATFSF